MTRGTDLYRLQCTLYDRDGTRRDVHEHVLGLRQVRLIRSREAIHFQINKVPFFIRGTSYMGGLYLSQLTEEQIEESGPAARRHEGSDHQER